MASRNASAPQMKGTVLRSFVDWYEQDVATGAVRQAIAQLPEKHGAAFNLEREDLGLLPNRWYRAEAIHAVLDTLLASHGEEAQRELARRGGEAIVTAMRRGVHRVLFDWFLTPGRYTKIVDRAWKLNYDNGHVVTTVLDPNRHKGVVVGWRGHHRFLCALNVGIKRSIYAAMGCAEARIESRYCTDDGDPECGSIIAWDDARPDS